MRVLKFGGTSVGSPQNIEKLGHILKDYKQQKIEFWIVVSAISGVTNKLLDLGKLAQDGNPAYKVAFNDLKAIHLDTISQLIPSNNQKTINTVSAMLSELEQLTNGIFLLNEFSARSADAIASFGERLSATIIADYLTTIGLDASYLDARLLVKTNSNFTHALLNQSQTYAGIQEYKQHSNGIKVITGFIGSNEQGVTTTLGRGGSDYSAAIFGAALNASLIEIWTDVDGVMTADPRKVKEAYSMPALTFNEAMEMSHFGAKVIYPPTLVPAIEKNIPLVIKNTFNPSFEGTIISKSATTKDFPVKGISSIDHVALITITGSGMMGVPGTASRIFSVLANESINVILITQASSEHSISIAISPSDTKKAIIALENGFKYDIANCLIDPIFVDEEKAVLAVIGENMKKAPGIAGRLFNALGKNGINISAIAQGSSEYNISIVVDKKLLSKGLNVLHEAFFLSNRKNINLFLVGTGLIGSTLLSQISQQSNYLLNDRSIKINLIGLSNSRNMAFDEKGIDINNWQSLIEKPGNGVNLSDFVAEMIAFNMPNSVFVDCTSNAEVIGYYEEILQNSVSIVTPNKLANSGEFANYTKLKSSAQKFGCRFLYETNVGAGLPIISTMHDLLVSGDKIKKIEGILSGTISYIFNTFSETIPFSEAVKMAMDLGLTEPDPREDLNGQDVARKLLILAREAGLALEPDDVVVEPLLPKACFDAKDVSQFFEILKQYDNTFQQKAKEHAAKGEKLRFIAKLEKGNAKISLEAVDQEHPFYQLAGSDNVISFTTKRYANRPLVVKGPGAGAEVTAAGVFAEIIAAGTSAFLEKIN